MIHNQSLPPIHIPFRQRLSYRQARTAVLLGLGVGLLLGIGQVTLDLFTERHRIRTTIAQVLEVIRETAGQAIYQQNAIQADKVLTGLFNCQSIYQANLHTTTGALFLQKTRPYPTTGLSKWLESILLAQAGEISTPLRFNDHPAGRLSISVDAYISAKDFMMRAGFTLLNNLLAAILLAIILTSTFYHLLTRPLLMLGDQLAQLDPTAPNRQPLTVPPSHAHNELGLLTHSLNLALTSFASTLQRHKQTEQLLKRTQFSVDQAVDMVCWIGPNGNFIYVNEAMSLTVEYSQDELLSMTVNDINPNLTLQQWTDHWNDLKQTKKSHMETIIQTKSGRMVPLDVHSTLLEIDGQEIHCHFARDITSRKTAEQAVHHAHKILLTLSHGNEAMIKAASEQELLARICHLIVQEGGYRMVWVGYATSDEHQRIIPVAQYGFDDGYLENLDITWADTPKGRGPTGTAFRTRQPAISRMIQTDPNFTPWRQEATRHGFASSLALPLPNGDLLPLGTLNIYSELPDAFDQNEIQLMANLANNLAFGILKFREAEERRRAQKAKQLSEEKLLALFHHSPDCLMTLDKNGTLQFCNRNGSKHLQKLISDSMIPHFQEHLAVVFQTGQAVEYPFTDGDSTWWEARLAPIFHEGRVTEVLAVCQDITEKHTLQAQNLRNARLASLGVLSASVAHEINNPNNAIQFNVPILSAIWEEALPILQNAHTNSGPFYLGGMVLTEAMEVIPQLLDGIRMSSQRIKTIIGSLKHMARQDHEVMTQTVNILDPLHSSLMILANQIRQTTDHCHLTPALTHPLLVKGNAQQLEQAFINILQNALQSLRNRSEGVRITTAKDPNSQIVITFHDQGSGITPEHMNKLTNPFFTTKTSSGGMGLGLSITKTIIENHSGELLFTSQPNCGTTVTIRLPSATEFPHGDPICPPN